MMAVFQDASKAAGSRDVAAVGAPGRAAVMCTDGLVEHHEAGLTAGIDNLEQLVAAWSPEALLDCAELARVANSSPSPDDTCLLVVKFG